MAAAPIKCLHCPEVVKLFEIKVSLWVHKTFFNFIINSLVKRKTEVDTETESAPDILIFMMDILFPDTNFSSQRTDQNLIPFKCLLINTNGTAVLTVTLISCSLSIIGATAILYSYARLRTIRDDTRTLLLFLTIADFLTATAYLMGPICILNGTPEFHSSAACVVQSFITTFLGMASFFWTVAIAMHIFCNIVYGTTYVHKRIIFCCGQLVCWGVPATISITALMMNKLGANWESTGPWCWIRSDLKYGEKVAWMILTGKGWEFLSYFTSANLYIFAKMHMYFKRRRHRYNGSVMLGGPEDNAESNDVTHRNSFLFLLMALYLLRVWGSCRFVINILTQHLKKEISCTVQYILLMLQSYGDSGQGFWNFVIFFCLDKEVKFRLLCCCCEENETIDGPGTERQRLLHGVVDVN